MEALSKEELLYAHDLGLVSESREDVKRRQEDWNEKG